MSWVHIASEPQRLASSRHRLSYSEPVCLRFPIYPAPQCHAIGDNIGGREAQGNVRSIFKPQAPISIAPVLNKYSRLRRPDPATLIALANLLGASVLRGTAYLRRTSGYCRTSLDHFLDSSGLHGVGSIGFSAFGVIAVQFGRIVGRGVTGVPHIL